MQKISSFFLLIVFLCNAAGFYNVYEFQKNKSRKHRDLKTTQKALLKVCIPASSSLKAQGYTRLGKNEFQYNGRFYDVIRRKRKGNEVVVYLMRDSYEEELISFIHSFFNTSTQSNQQKRLASNLKMNMMKQFLATVNHGLKKPLVTTSSIRSKRFILPNMPCFEVRIPPPRKA